VGGEPDPPSPLHIKEPQRCATPQTSPTLGSSFRSAYPNPQSCTPTRKPGTHPPPPILWLSLGTSDRSPRDHEPPNDPAQLPTPNKFFSIPLTDDQGHTGFLLTIADATFLWFPKPRDLSQASCTFSGPRKFCVISTIPPLYSLRVFLSLRQVDFFHPIWANDAATSHNSVLDKKFPPPVPQGRLQRDKFSQARSLPPSLSCLPIPLYFFRNLPSRFSLFKRPQHTWIFEQQPLGQSTMPNLSTQTFSPAGLCGAPAPPQDIHS